VVASVVLIAVLLLGSPFLGVKWGFPDDRVLTASASSREVGDLLRTEFAVSSVTNASVVVPDMSNVSPEQLSDYAAQLSRVSDVSGVSTPAGTFVSGVLAGSPSAPVWAG
jgi:RND superfamily putative drug exporter